MFSTFTPTQMFGTMMLVILFAALFGDLIFLPSILTGPAGRFFYKKKKKVVQEEPKSETLEPTPTPALTVPNSTIDLQVDDRYVGRCHIVDNMLDNENNKIGE